MTSIHLKKKKNSNWLEIVSKKVKSLLAAFNGLVETTHNYPRPPDPFKCCPSSKSKSIDHRWKIAIAQCASRGASCNCSLQVRQSIRTHSTSLLNQVPGIPCQQNLLEWKECLFSVFYKFRQRRFRDGHKFHPSPAEPGTRDEKRVFFDRSNPRWVAVILNSLTPLRPHGLFTSPTRIFHWATDTLLMSQVPGYRLNLSEKSRFF